MIWEGEQLYSPAKKKGKILKKGLRCSVYLLGKRVVCVCVCELAVPKKGLKQVRQTLKYDFT